MSTSTQASIGEFPATPFTTLQMPNETDQSLFDIRGETFLQSMSRNVRSVLTRLFWMAFAVWTLLVGVEVQKIRNPLVWERVVKVPAEYANHLLQKRGW